VKHTKFAWLLAATAIVMLVLSGCPTGTDPVLDTNTDLASLAIDGVTLSPAFAAGTIAYTATVPYSTTSVTVSAAALTATSTVTGTGAKALVVGANTISVVVTAEDATTKTYTVTVTRTAPATIADVTSLRISDVMLSPLFDPAITTYDGTANGGVASVLVSATMASPFAVVTVNGVSATQAVTLGANPTNLSIVITAEDGVTTKTYTVAITQLPVFDAATSVNIEYLVTESINGTILADVLVGTNAENGTAFGYTDANGKVTLSTPKTDAGITSMKDGYAANTLQIADASAVTSAVLVNQHLGMITKEAAPVMANIALIAKTADLSDLAPYTGTAIDTNGPTFLVVIAGGTYGCAPTAWSGFGAKLDFGRTPTTFNGIEGVMMAEPEWDAGNGMYLTYFLFDLSDIGMPAGTQDVRIVAYDVANNRGEYRTPIIFNYNPGGVDISAGTFKAFKVDLRNFPVSRGYFGETNSSTMALNQYEGRDTSYRASIEFKFQEAATTTNVAITGFDVYRSTDNVTFVKIGSQIYGAPNSGSLSAPPNADVDGVHTYFDTDSRLVMDGSTIYYYKIVAINGSFTNESSVGQCYLSAPFSYNLSAPLNRATMSAAAPHNYSFTISNTSLWNASQSDFFCFSLKIREKSGTWKFIGQFRYNFSTAAFQIKYGNGSWFTLADFGLAPADITYADGTITIKAAVLDSANVNWALGGAMAYQNGVAYQWDITGDSDVLGGGGHPAWFEKTTSGGLSRTYGNGYNEGGDAMNGLFEFNVIN